MKKILASILTIAMLATTMSACVIPASAADVDETNVIYSEDFSGYEQDVNWLTKRDSSGYVKGITGANDNVWRISIANLDSTTDSVTTQIGNVKVVDDPAGNDTERGQVLKIDLDGGASDTGKTPWVQVVRNVNGEKTGIARADMSAGKKLVLSADVYIPSTRTENNGTTPFLGYRTAASTAYNLNDYTTIRTYIVGNGIKMIANSPVYNSPGSASAVTSTKATDNWVTIKRIVDVSAPVSATRPADTTRHLYKNADGEVLMAIKTPSSGYGNAMGTRVINDMFKWKEGNILVDTWFDLFSEVDGVKVSKVGDFYGSVFGESRISTDATEAGVTGYYIDNVEAYWIDALKQQGDVVYENKDSEGKWYAGTIEIPFNNEIKSSVTVETAFRNAIVSTETLDLTKLVKLVDASGAEVSGGVTNAYLKDGDSKVLVVVPAKDLATDSTYTIVADSRFSDVYGQGLGLTGSINDTIDIHTFTVGFNPNIYDEGFENYTKNIDWYQNVNTSNYVTAEGVETGAFSIYKDKDGAGHSIMVKDDPTSSGQGKVLVLSRGTTTNTTYTHFRINASGNTGIDRANMPTGKKLVYEAKFYVPTGYSGGTEMGFFVNQANATPSGIANGPSGAGGTMTSAGGVRPIVAGAYNGLLARPAGMPVSGKWSTIRHVVDVSKELSVTHSDTTRGYLDGVLYTGVLKASIPGYWEQGWNDKYQPQIGTLMVDHLPARTRFFYVDAETDKEYESFGTFYGSNFNLYANAAEADVTAGTVANEYYLDDLKAYWIDALTYTANNVTDYTGGKVELKFNQKIRETVDAYNTGSSERYNANYFTQYSLSDLVYIVDGDGNKVSETSVELSEDKKTVIITPGKLTANTEYKIVIDPYFVDEYGQGLENNSTATEIALSVGEIVPFELISVSETNVTRFTQGRDVKITAVFSTNVSDDAITEGIVVTNTDTGATVARDAGWSAAFGEDSKTVTFDFGNLPTANYSVTTDEDFVAANGDPFVSDLEITISVAKTVLFTEDFETGYVVGENWITDANKVTDISATDFTSYTVNDHTWDIQVNGTMDGTDWVGVKDVTDLSLGGGFSGKALRLYNSRGGTYKNQIVYRRNFDKLNGISLKEGKYKGKLLVYEMDIVAVPKEGETKVFSDNNVTVAPNISFNKDTIYMRTNYFLNQFRYNQELRISENTAYTGNKTSNYFWFIEPNTGTSAAAQFTTAQKLRIVLDETSEKDHIRVYRGGNLLTHAFDKSTTLPDHARNGQTIYDFAGASYKGTGYNVEDLVHYGIWGESQNAEIYIDNFTAYVVDPFVIESVDGASDVYNAAKGAITYTFSTPVDETTIDGNISLVNAEGNPVTGGIASYEVEDGGHKLTVKLLDTLPGLTSYTVKLGLDLSDIYGNCISPEYSWYKYTTTAEGYIVNGDGTVTYTPSGATSTVTAQADCYLKDPYLMQTAVDITTSKSTSVFAEASAATVGDNAVSTSIKFTNPELTAMNVWAVVAAYGEYNEMLGCTPVSKELSASEATTDETVTVNVKDGSAVKSVKLYVWNSYADMKPYQPAETLFSK